METEPPERLLQIIDQLARETRSSRMAFPTLDMSLERDLGFDSLARVELLLRIEQAFGVHLGEAVLVGAETPGDLLNALGLPQIRTEKAGIEFEPGVEGLPHGAQTLVEVLDWHVSRHPDRLHIQCEDSGVKITYAELRSGAEAMAYSLVERGVKKGESIAVMLPTGPDYFFSFFGIILAGCIPVPIYPPFRPSGIEDHLRRHAGILGNANATMMITFEEAMRIAKLLKLKVSSMKEILMPDALRPSGRKVDLPVLKREDIAFLQYTSGSTGNPKGVILTHANLLANIRAMGEAAKVDSLDVFVSWLPLYHDMGLIGAWLGSLYHAARYVVMAPTAFLARPSRWLFSIARNRATLTASPNFGYALCLAKIEEKTLSGLDLSSLRMAFNGAEPVSAEVIRDFSEKFGKYGFRENAFAPVYGLAESSVGLAFTPPGRGGRIDFVDRERFTRHGKAWPAGKGGIPFVSCGFPLPGHEIRIVDGTGREVGERQEGRLEFRGPSSTSGYFGNVDATAKLFHDGWLDSGDYAYIAEGEVYPTGRAKDLIIRAGRNIYPYEAEEAVGNIPGIRRGCVAIFGVPRRGTEQLVVMAEARTRDEGLHEAVNKAVIDVLGEPPDEILLVPPHTVLKTSSGKIRRAACRQRYLEGFGMRRFDDLRRIFEGFVPQFEKLAGTWISLLYASYVWAVFWMIAPLAWISALIIPNRKWNWNAGRKLARLFLGLSGIKLTVKGTEHVRCVPSVLVANHASYIDGIILIAALPPCFFSFVAKRELRDSFISRIYLERLGVEFVERSGLGKEAGRLEVLAKKGRAMIFFPEGTFTRKPGLARFHMGAFLAASNAGVPVVPIALKGTRSVLRDESWFPRKGLIEMTVGEPIHPEGSGWRSAILLRDVARKKILEHCGEPDLR